MTNPASTPSSVALRVATAMYQMGIEGLPRNYELVYDAYSGANPLLSKEFVGLGKIKTQNALDALGKKYLPHHHEEAVVSKTSDRMRAQMSSFISLLEEEKASLSDYGKIIDEASRSFSKDGGVDPDTITRSIEQLSKATEQQASKSQVMVAEAQEQSAALDDVKTDIDNFERMKFVDQLTGLANRRAFNKAVARIYANPELPMMCGLAYAEIDGFKAISEGGNGNTGDYILRHIGNLIRTANGSGDFVARLDGNRFAFLIKIADENEIMRLVDVLRAAAGSKPLVNPKNGRSFGNATLSIGVAMATITNGAGQLMEYAEKALETSSKGGGNRVTLYSNTAPVANASNAGWMIYLP